MFTNNDQGFFQPSSGHVGGAASGFGGQGSFLNDAGSNIQNR